MAKSGTMKFYMSAGAAQFTLLPPRWDDKGFMSKEGAVLLEAAPGNGDKVNPKWDWTKKITFAIGFADMCNLLDDNPKKNRLFHQHGTVSKSLEFKPGTGNWTGTYQLIIAQGKGSDRTQIMVPLSGGQYGAMMRVFVDCLSALVGFKTMTADNSVSR